GVARWDEHHALAVEIDETADPGRDERPGVPHRLARREAVALAPRRHADDGRALVVRAELGRRDEADRFRDARAQRAVADDHARQPLGRLDELEHSLLLAQAAREEHVRRRLLGRLYRRGQVYAVRDDENVPG